MPLSTVTLTTAASSVPGASTACALNWRNGMPTTVSITASSSQSFVYIQATYDDIMRVPSSLVTWASITTATEGSTSGTSFASSNFSPDAVTHVFTGPVGAVRMNSSGLGGVLTMKILQGESW